MAACNLIDSCISYDCTTASVSGLADSIILVNYSDITATYDPLDDSKITALTFAAGTKGYVFEGSNKTFSYSNEPTRTEFGTWQYKHLVNGRIISVDNETTGIVRKLQGSLVVAITFGNNGVIRVHGINSGMICETLDNSAEMNSTWQANFYSDEPNFEKLPGYTYDTGGTFAAMKLALINAASCPPVV